MSPSDQRPPLAALGGAALLSGLSGEALAEVASRATVKRARGGSTIFREGEPAAAFYLVTAGRVKLTQAAADGHEVIVRIVGAADALAAVALFAGATYPATARAVSDTRLLVWSREALEEIFHRHPKVAVNALRIVSERLREAQDRMRELATERVAQRIARALVRLVRQAGRRVEGGVLIDLPLSRRDVAEMTGTTLYTASRVLSEWEMRGIVKSGRGRVVVVRPHALVALAEDLPERAAPPPAGDL